MHLALVLSLCNTHLWRNLIFSLLLVGVYYVLWQNSLGGEMSKEFLFCTHIISAIEVNISCIIFDVLECNWIFVQLFVNTTLPSNTHRTLSLDNIDEKHAETVRKESFFGSRVYIFHFYSPVIDFYTSELSELWCLQYYFLSLLVIGMCFLILSFLMVILCYVVVIKYFLLFPNEMFV